MSRNASGLYRRKDGTERLYLTRSDVEAVTEETLRKVGLFSTEQQPAVDIERFIEELGVRLDQHADLDTSILGKTEFFPNRPPKISINRNLTGALDDDQTPKGIRGRWRATLAHEAGHVLLHSILFTVSTAQTGLFRVEQPESHSLMRCLKTNVLFRDGGSDWREVQANMAMAALLMPKHIFRNVAHRVIGESTLAIADLVARSRAAAVLVARMSEEFDVSKEAATIRLRTLEILSPVGQRRLAPLPE